MAIRRLISLTRRAGNHTHLFTTRKSLSTAAHGATLPSPRPPTAMTYGRLSESVKEKLKKLEDPDPRFLKYNSPHPTAVSHGGILASPLTRVTTLPNGLRIATESSPASKTATVGVSIDAGSRFESQESSGSAYFTEHMLEWEIENMCDHLNVFTSRDSYTSREQKVYYFKVVDTDVPQALDILADIIQHPKFDHLVMHRARDVILREMEEIEGQIEDVVSDHLHATAFQQTPLGRSILGPAANIKRIGTKHLQDYIAAHYTGPRMVIAASGAVKHEDIVERVKKLFTKVGIDPTTASDLVAREPAVYTGSEVRMLDDDLSIDGFAVVFVGIPSIFRDVFWIAMEPDCLDDLSYAIMHEMTKLCYRVTEDDVIRACNQLKSSLLLPIDGTCSVAEDIGHRFLAYGRRIPYPELFARIDAVDASTIKRVATRFIFDRDIVTAAVGPIQGLPDYNWFRRRTYWLRY